MLKNDEIRQVVHDLYSQAANNECCGSTCCSGLKPELAEHMGYSPDELKAVPTGANLGFGCGNPQAIAALKPGEMVLDLGSGAGFDCFLAARQVGESGQVIGVDMTQEMLSKARANARNNGVLNVEFRLGEIEHLPVADNSIDVILSNCVINLSTDKPRVFEEAFRVLKPGGRLAISDIVALSEFPEQLRDDLSLHGGCMAGATPVAELAKMLQSAGFENVRIIPNEKSRNILEKWTKNKLLYEMIVSAAIEAIKPKL